MKSIGRRIFYDQDGEIITVLGEQFGSASERKVITNISYIDLEYSEVNNSTHTIVGVDTLTKKPILQEILPYISEEEKMIKELEDALLLQTEKEIGGIL